MDESLLTRLLKSRAQSMASGSPSASAKLQAQGKLSARERLQKLFDQGSFVELGLLARSANPALVERTPADGVITGHGLINGRVVFAAADDVTVLGGTRGKVGEAKISKVRAAALAQGKPFVALMEAGAARIQESSGAMAAAMGSRFGEHFQMSGRVPQVAVIMGNCFGGPSFTAAQSDFTIIVKDTGFMGMSGPLLVKAGIGMDVTAEQMGGSQMSVAETGQADYLAQDEADALATVRTYLSLFPDSSAALRPIHPHKAALLDAEKGRQKLYDLIPIDDRRAYRMERVLALLVDEGSLFPYRADYGQNLITSWACFSGRVVGIIASNPAVRAGVLDESTAQKARKFIDLCDAFHIPLVFFCDCPGFLVGPDVEQKRMISQASRLINTVYGATVPKITIVVRKAIGLAYLALGGGKMGAHTLLAWPTARFDVMGPDAALELVHKREIQEASNPVEKRHDIRERIREASSAWRAAELGLIDDVIDPAETRHTVITALERLGPTTLGFKHRIDP